MRKTSLGDGAVLADPEEMFASSDDLLVRIAVTGGGTGGHTSPILAVVDELRQRLGNGLALLWLGSKTGPEAGAAAARSIPFAVVPSAKLRRYADVRNLTELPLLPLGLAVALRELRRFRPAALLSTGGYVSLPPTVAAFILRIPILVHEQTALAGLATRLEGRLATRVAVSFPSSVRYFPSDRTVLSGNPVRREVMEGDRRKGLTMLGFDETLPVVYVTGGIQGAHALNRLVGECLEEMLRLAQVVHQCGHQPPGFDQDLSWLASLQGRLPPELRRRYVVRERIGHEIGHVYAAADLVVSRAGAGTVFELAAVGKPAVLIPLPGSASGEQRLNATALEKLGAAVVVDQRQLTATAFLDLLRELLANRERLSTMGERARRLYRPDAAAVLTETLLELAATKSGTLTKVL